MIKFMAVALLTLLATLSSAENKRVFVDSHVVQNSHVRCYKTSFIGGCKEKDDSHDEGMNIATALIASCPVVTVTGDLSTADFQLMTSNGKAILYTHTGDAVFSSSSKKPKDVAREVCGFLSK
jgi:hypothetical protein